MHGRASLLARLSIGIRPRLLLILGIATGAVLIASAMALVALLELRTELRAVTERALPASDAALVLARVGERLQDRTPALMMAKDLDARRRQTELIRQDLLLSARQPSRRDRCWKQSASPTPPSASC
jgi:phosphoglycerate-specific signal transduction histidine kinase